MQIFCSLECSSKRKTNITADSSRKWPSTLAFISKNTPQTIKRCRQIIKYNHGGRRLKNICLLIYRLGNLIQLLWRQGENIGHTTLHRRGEVSFVNLGPINHGISSNKLFGIIICTPSVPLIAVRAILWLQQLPFYPVPPLKSQPIRMGRFPHLKSSH